MGYDRRPRYDDVITRCYCWDSVESAYSVLGGSNLSLMLWFTFP